MRGKGLYLVVLAAVMLLGACAPRATTAPAPVPVAPQAAPAAPSSAIPALSPEEAAWAKVMEAAKREGRVTAYSFNLGGDVGIAVSRAFENRYGLKMDIITGRGAEQLERLKTERRIGRMVADFMDGSPNHNLNAKKGDLTVSLRELPVLKETREWLVDPFVLDKDGHVAMFTYVLMGVHINTRLVRAGEQPASWNDLLKPVWKGKIIVPDPLLSGTLYTTLLPLVSRGLLALEYVSELGKQNPLLSRGTGDAAEMVAKGEVSLGLTSTSSGALFMAEGAPLKIVDMKEGTALWGNVFTLVKDSPHPNAAKVFGNWLLSPEGQKVQAEARSSSSVRKDVPNFEPPGARLEGKIIPLTADDADQTSDAFARRLWVDMIKRK